MVTDQIQYDVARAKKLADDLGLSIADWSKKARVSEFTLRKWIYGEPTVKFSTVEAIARAIGTTALKLVKSGDGKKRA